MVTTDISQLAAECNTWILNLRKYREEFTQNKQRLQEVASRQIPKSTLQDVEHFQNQFHIQLINIHDVKHAIKNHERTAAWQQSSGTGKSDDVWANHENLYDRYQHLEHVLSELSSDFNLFMSRAR